MLDELKISKKYINIKINDNRWFLWCHSRHLNPSETHPERNPKMDREMADSLNYSDINFLVSQKDYSKIEKKNSICINLFGYENNLIYPIHVSDEIFEDCMDLLLITDDSCFMFISKILRDLTAITQNIETENTFKDIGCSALVMRNYWEST